MQPRYSWTKFCRFAAAAAAAACMLLLAFTFVQAEHPLSSAKTVSVQRGRTGGPVASAC